MAETEELRIILRTIADNAGANRTRESLRQVRTEAGDANRATQGLSGGFRVGAGDAIRFAGALTGVNIGLSLATSAGLAVRDSIVGAIESQAESQRVARATAAAYGESAGQFTRFSESLSAQTGFTKTSILEAALSARTLSENYGLTIQQTQRLISVSADLAQVRGIGVAEAFERVQSAIRGEAEASEFLGLTLNDTFLKNVANNGSFRDTFEVMSDAEKAQIRYTEVLRQTQNFQGLAARGSGDLGFAMRQASTAGAELSTELGKIVAPAVIGGLQLLSDTTRTLASGLREAAIAAADIKLPQLSGPELPGGGQLGFDVSNLSPQLGLFIDLINLARQFRELEQQAIREQRQADDDRLRRLRELNQELAPPGTDPWSRVIPPTIPRDLRNINGSIFDPNVLQKARSELEQFVDAMTQAQNRASQLGGIRDALLPDDVAVSAALGALQRVEQVEARVAAQRAAVARLEEERARLQKAVDIGGPVRADAERRLVLLNALLPLEQQLADAQREQAEVQKTIAAGNTEEARVLLAILPQRQEIARLEREIANSVDRQVTLRQEETRLLAQQRALGPQAALEDTEATIERNRLLLQIRGLAPELRRQALVENINLQLNTLPQQRLEAFDVARGVTLATQAERATELASQIRANELRQQQEAVRGGIQPVEDRLFQLQQQNENNLVIGRVLESNTTQMVAKLDEIVKRAVEPVRVALQLQVTSPDGSTQTYDELIEATGQAQSPPVIQLSGAR